MFLVRAYMFTVDSKERTAMDFAASGIDQKRTVHGLHNVGRSSASS
jgi:hypothetical protein